MRKNNSPERKIVPDKFDKKQTNDICIYKTLLLLSVKNKCCQIKENYIEGVAGDSEETFSEDNRGENWLIPPIISVYFIPENRMELIKVNRFKRKKRRERVKEKKISRNR